MPRITIALALAAVAASGCGGPVDRYFTESADVDRYFAYANAVVGRAYDGRYVRTAGEWRRAFATPAADDTVGRTTLTPARPLVPYRDFLVEYPPAFFLVAAPPALLASTARSYTILFAGLMVAALLAAAVVAGRIAAACGAPMSSWTVAGWTTVAAAAIGTVSIQRYDAVVSLLICVMCWAAMARRPAICGGAAALGIAAKATPLLVAGTIAVWLARQRRYRELRAAILCAVVVSAVAWGPALIAAPAGLGEFVRYHRDRPLEIGSSGAALLGLARAVDGDAARMVRSFGSSNVVGPFDTAVERASTIAMAAGIAVVWWWVWRSGDRAATREARARFLAAGSAAVLAVFVATAKVASPQYVVWFVPLAIVVSRAAAARPALSLFLGAALLTQIVYPVIAPQLEALRPWACSLVLCRNLTLVVWAWTSASSIRG